MAVVTPALGLDPHTGATIGLVAVGLFGLLLVARDYRTGETDRSDEQPRIEQSDSVSDTERIRELLVENDGRMRQSDIVDSVDWSKAKVSRLLSELEDEEEISKLRLGRENLVCLPGNEPSASRSPERARTD